MRDACRRPPLLPMQVGPLRSLIALNSANKTDTIFGLKTPGPKTYCVDATPQLTSEGALGLAVGQEENDFGAVSRSCT
jgi:hypothetical protein